MLNKLPKDQRELLVHRLGMPRIRKIEERIRKEDWEFPRKGVNHARVMPPITSFYWACVKEMGSLSKTPSAARVPNPAMAWLQVLHQRGETEPTFTHHKIAETITYFGGWEQMWFRFNKIQEDRARNQFVMSFKELTE